MPGWLGGGKIEDGDLGVVNQQLDGAIRRRIGLKIERIECALVEEDLEGAVGVKRHGRRMWRSRARPPKPAISHPDAACRETRAEVTATLDVPADIPVLRPHPYAEIAVFVEAVREDLDSHFGTSDESTAGRDESDNDCQSGAAKGTRAAICGRKCRVVRNDHVKIIHEILRSVSGALN